MNISKSKNNHQLDPQLKALSEATRSITSELSLEQVLQKIVQSARSLIKTKYVALGIRDEHGNLSRFITTGIDPENYAKIGNLPTGNSLLGAFLEEGKSLIVNDIAGHPASTGFPKHHPQMHNLLGVPIFSKEKLIGALYLTDKQNGSLFTETDRQLIEMLALHAAIAIENAHLYEQTQRLAILEERERFARDLHDGIIQSIYAVGLSLDNAKVSITPTNKNALEQIDVSLKNLANVINDIRNYIFDLRPQALKDKGLYARIQGLIQELKVNTMLSIEAEVAPDINDCLNETQASHIFHIAHEALANAVRHAKARKIQVRLRREKCHITLQIQDDGIGFNLPANINHGHRGLANIQKRASVLGANLNIQSYPGQGTYLILTLKSSKSVEKTRP